MQSKCLLRLVDDDIESPYKSGPDIIDHLSAAPLQRAHVTS